MSFRPEGYEVARSGEIYFKQISRLRFAALEMTQTSTFIMYNWYYTLLSIKGIKHCKNFYYMNKSFSSRNPVLLSLAMLNFDMTVVSGQSHPNDICKIYILSCFGVRIRDTVFSVAR